MRRAASVYHLQRHTSMALAFAWCASGQDLLAVEENRYIARPPVQEWLTSMRRPKLKPITWLHICRPPEVELHYDGARTACISTMSSLWCFSQILLRHGLQC